MDGEEANVNTSLEWVKQEQKSGPDVWDTWEAKTPQALYHIGPAFSDMTELNRQPDKPWLLSVELPASPAQKLNSKQRRQLRRQGGPGPTPATPELQYDIHCETREQAEAIASRHAATGSRLELEQRQQETPLWWETIDGFGSLYTASMPDGSGYSLDIVKGGWRPAFGSEVQNVNGPLCPTLDEAKAACERHRKTGKWE